MEFISYQAENSAKQLRGDDVIFQCKACGECCSSIMIHIEAEKWTVLKEREWVQERLQEFKTTVSPWNKAHVLLPHKSDKTCVFLDDEKRCLIERHEGTDLKPSECRNFPFASLQLDTGKRLYDCSAACKTVAEDLLLQYQSILPEPDWAESLPAQKAPEQVRLSPFQSLDWETYQSRLEELPSIFLEAKNAETAVYQAWLIISRKLNVKKNLQQQRWKQRLILLFFLRKPYNSYSTLQLLQKRRYRDPYVFGNDELPGIGILNDDMAFLEEAEALLKAFVFNILNRYVLLSHGHWVSDVFAIGKVAIVLVRWYACVLASLDSRQDVTRHDMAAAIRLTERYYTGHQPRFLAFFRRSIFGLHLGYLFQYCL